MPKQEIKKQRRKVVRAESEDEVSTPVVTTGKKRKSTEGESRNDAPRKRPRKDFAYLKPRTKRVPQEIIESQWKRLPEPAQRQVRELFLRSKRSALNGIKDARRRTEAEAAVNAMVRRLEKQLPRMPFPASAKPSHFNLDDIIVRNVSSTLR